MNSKKRVIINISIKELIGVCNISASNIKESAVKTKDDVALALTNAIEEIEILAPKRPVLKVKFMANKSISPLSLYPIEDIQTTGIVVEWQFPYLPQKGEPIPYEMLSIFLGREVNNCPDGHWEVTEIDKWNLSDEGLLPIITIGMIPNN